ncbi:hypothetical protein ASU31_25750 [Pedobacter ginsenosidimutans]|uniref:TIR domain-containing protein n=1 Tax=Pedobacter ginsenosidimutans TaxID=687842 RepID=A0A0T5VH52_9SPHI|nr:toll/interleukin-1 receptor domain-containing protein [Pedobacter ginsenosidimutans]KRT13208.1 hypothetical protein ASU31_25750 [Pedobacter ginsenosidimutans]
MQEIRYELLLLGHDSPMNGQIVDTLFAQLDLLGVDKELLKIVKAEAFSFDGKDDHPQIALYHSGPDMLDGEILEKVIKNAKVILPIFKDGEDFNKVIPKVLHEINGIKVSSQNDIPSIVNHILEGFGFLRASRRLFISYRQNESRGVAVQLFEKLSLAGFDVFLDTHSIPKGDVFQDELWHRLVDTDVVVLLNTLDFLGSEWTRSELARASAMSIGILQLTWPDHVPERDAQISVALPLAKRDFVRSRYLGVSATLKNERIANIVRQTELLRARTLSARQTNIITEFVKFSSRVGKVATLQKERFMTMENSQGREIVVIPTIGVPNAFSYHQSEDLIRVIRTSQVEKIYLLYDHLNIRMKWLEHLAWLDKFLPVVSVRVSDMEDWFNKI